VFELLLPRIPAVQRVKTAKRRRCPTIPRDTSPTLDTVREKQFLEPCCWLFSRKDGILHCLADAKLERGLCGDLDCLARSRVPTFARFPFGSDQLPEAGEHELTVRLDLVSGQCCQILE